MSVIRIYLDPGHGGYDPGAVGPTGVREKDCTLQVALRVGELLKARGISVGYSRTMDIALGATQASDLSNRAAWANIAKAQYFLSIHINSFTNHIATGTETYCLALGGEGEKLAKSVQSALVNEIKLPNRGVKTANFQVLRETAMPAALVEVCFISNPGEEKRLKDADFLEKAAVGIAKGVCGFLGVQYKVFDNNGTIVHSPEEWAHTNTELLIEKTYDKSKEKTSKYWEEIAEIEKKMMDCLGPEKALLVDLGIARGMIENEHIIQAYRIGRDAYKCNEGNK